MNEKRSVAFGKCDHIIGQDRVAAPRQRRRGGGFSGALGSHKRDGVFAKRHRACVQACDAAHA